MIDYDAIDPARDKPRVRELQLVNATLTFISDGPFGFWRITTNRGLLPARLRGTWLSFEDAKSAAVNYFNNNRKIPKTSPEYDDSMHIAKAQATIG